MTSTDHHSSVAPMLSGLDRTVLIGVPLILASATLASPTGPTAWLLVLAGLLVVAWGMALAGAFGRARWRGSTYPVVVLAIATIGLWTQGPSAGVGAGFALAALIAGAMLSRVGLGLVIGVAFAAIAVRASGWLPTPELITTLRFDGIQIWIRIAIAITVVSWIATRALGALIASLEQSYERAVDAYQRETQTQAELESSRKELDEVEHLELVGRLAGGVAHDINNALTAILSASDLLGDKVTTAEERRCVAELDAASHQAAELVRDLLWIGRKFPPTTESADVEQAVAACVQRLERIGRKLELPLHAPPSRVALAPERLEQVLFRVALRARSAGVARLVVTGTRADGMVVLDLHGVIENAPRSSSQKLRPRAISSQLGMSAAIEVVEQAGGSFTITEQTNELRVGIRLPLGQAEQRATLPPIDRPRTALVVDDEPLVLGRLAKLVGRRGYAVMSASSLAEAWPLLATGPDLLVTDLQLGDGDGEDLAIASFERAAERPIVICSGFGADEALRERLRDARVRFLSKPFTLAELEDAIPHATEDVA